ncbi:MAG: AAA family ATPase [Caldilineaceae bacterium]
MSSPTTPPAAARNHTPHLTIRLLGDFAVTYGDEAITQINTPRLQALLAYLLLHRDAPQNRRHLAFRFWPDSSEAQALTNLRKHLLHLKRALPAGDQWLVTDRHTLQWAPQVACKLDVADFRLTLAQVEQHESDVAIAQLRQAIDLYQGELLPGCYDEWILPLREELQGQYFTALERLSTRLEEQHAYAEAIHCSLQLLRHDALHEATYRRLIRLYALNDDRAAALRTYHSCVTQLRNELGVDPDEETQAVYERLLHGAPPTTTTIAQLELAANAPFVSRQPEWQRLQQRWQAALRGAPQFVLIAGEAGIGKTRLAEELLNWANHQGFCTVRARCYAAEGRLAYAPVIDWLRTEKLRSSRAKLANTWLRELARLLPEILSEHPTLSAPDPITQSLQRHHLFEAAARALLMDDQPLLLLIDDLQWCDKETLELLHFLLRNVATISQTKLLLIGTARLPDEVDTTHPLYELLNPLRGSDTLTQIDLTRLTQAETSELANQMTARQLDSHSLNQLFVDTAGNPLFVVETMRAGDGKITLSGKSDTSLLLPSETNEEILQQLPPKVLAVIQSRLAQLSSAARELCEWAAVIGRSFTLELLVSGSKMTQDKAVNALDELWQRRIIHEQGTEAYDFSHDRIRDVVMAGISRVRRKYLHRCIAEALEQEPTSQLNHIAAQLAAHYDAAGSVEKAIDYYAHAADRAAQIYATDQTIAHRQRAIILLKTLPRSKARDQRELSLLMALAPTLANVTNFEVTLMRNVYERAHLLSQQLGVALHPSMLRVLAIHRAGQRDFEQTQAMGQQMLEIAGQQSSREDKVIYLEGSYVLGISAFWQGFFPEASAYLQQVVDLHACVRQEHDIIEYGQDTGIYCRTRLGWTLWYLGYPAQARQQCELSIALAHQLRHPFTLFLVSAYSAWCACNCQSAATAEPLIRSLHTIMDSASVQQEDQFGFFSGWLLLLQGKIDESLKQLSDQAVLQKKQAFSPLGYPHTVTLLAEAHGQAGNYQQGLVALDEAFAALEGNHNYWYVAEMYRLKGKLLIGQGQAMANAEACLRQALAIAHQQQAKALELRAAMSLSRLWAQQSKHKEAHTLLAEVYHWFTEGFDTPDLLAAKQLLEEKHF